MCSVRPIELADPVLSFRLYRLVKINFEPMFGGGRFFSKHNLPTILLRAIQHYTKLFHFLQLVYPLAYTLRKGVE